MDDQFSVQMLSHYRHAFAGLSYAFLLYVCSLVCEGHM